MIVKIGFYKSGGFLCDRSLLVESMSSRLLLDFREMFFELWKQIVKFVSLFVQINFSREKSFPGKTLSLIFFLRTGAGGGIFWIFRKKTDFWQKIVRRVIRTVLKVSRGTFWGERCFSENFSNKEMFSNVQQNFYFCRFLACLCKNRPCVQMNLLRKFFFEQIFV